MSCAARIRGRDRPKLRLTDQRAEFFGEGARIIPIISARFVGIAVPAHVGNEHRKARCCQERHHFVPRISRSEESMPQEYRNSVWIATDPVMDANPMEERRLAAEVGNFLWHRSISLVNQLLTCRLHHGSRGDQLFHDLHPGGGGPVLH